MNAKYGKFDAEKKITCHRYTPAFSVAVSLGSATSLAIPPCLTPYLQVLQHDVSGYL